MKNIEISALENCSCASLHTAKVYLLRNAHTDSFYEYSKYFLDLGFEKKEERLNDGRIFAAYLLDGTGVFINYFAGTHELYIVVEDDTKYFSYVDKKRNVSVQPQFTHVGIELGMSYAVRLSDGRFVIFDGGTFIQDAQSLLSVLKTGSPKEKPVIAAWFITHPHADHFLAMKLFLENFMDEVVIESFMFNFPQLDDVENFPSLKAIHPINDSCIFDDMNEIFELINKCGSQIFTPHTGQIYEISGTKFEILVSVDDVINSLASQNLNTTSIVARFEIEGQTILITGDTRSADNNIVAKYRGYLKSDIFQVPHHGNQSGTQSFERKLYNYAAPSVCLIPTEEERGMVDFAPFRAGMIHLYNRIDYDEIIIGKATRTISLPYTAPKYAKEEFKSRLKEGIDSNGIKTWIFAGLNTSNPDDLEFCFTSMLLHWEATINIDLFFEAPTPCIKNIKTTLAAGTVRKYDLSQEQAFEAVPENTTFTARVKSSHPIIVSNTSKKADYQS